MNIDCAFTNSKFNCISFCKGYGFVEFKSEEDADYAIKIMHMIKLY